MAQASICIACGGYVHYCIHYSLKKIYFCLHVCVEWLCFHVFGGEGAGQCMCVCVCVCVCVCECWPANVYSGGSHGPEWITVLLCFILNKRIPSFISDRLVSGTDKTNTFTDYWPKRVHTHCGAPSCVWVPLSLNRGEFLYQAYTRLSLIECSPADCLTSCWSVSI